MIKVFYDQFGKFVSTFRMIEEIDLNKFHTPMHEYTKQKIKKKFNNKNEKKKTKQNIVCPLMMFVLVNATEWKSL